MTTLKLVMSSLTMMSAPTFYVGGHKIPLLHAVYDDDMVKVIIIHGVKEGVFLCWWARNSPPSRRL